VITPKRAYDYLKRKTMTNFTIGRWLLVALAIVGLALAPGLGSAHGNDTTADDAHPYDETADDWPTWMEDHVTDHMGPGAVEWMEDHMGVTVGEMAQDHDNHQGTNGQDHAGDYHGPYGQGQTDDHRGTHGQGHC
jgi:hypothetical protein